MGNDWGTATALIRAEVDPSFDSADAHVTVSPGGYGLWAAGEMRGCVLAGYKGEEYQRATDNWDLTGWGSIDQVVSRERGWGRILVAAAMQTLRANRYVALCWLNGTERSSLPMFTRLGWKPEGPVMGGLWAEHECVKCGATCSCSGRLVFSPWTGDL